ncbi:cupin domain-containing protein [Chloroflexota bacterium]
MVESTLTRASKQEHREQVMQQADIPALQMHPGTHIRPVIMPGATVSFVKLVSYSEMPRHIQEQDELVVIIQGARDDALDGKLFRLEEGDSLYVPKGAEHGSITYSTGCSAIEICAPGRTDLAERLESLLE